MSKVENGTVLFSKMEIGMVQITKKGILNCLFFGKWDGSLFQDGKWDGSLFQDGNWDGSDWKKIIILESMVI